jgi:hypothetical protein
MTKTRRAEIAGLAALICWILGAQIGGPVVGPVIGLLAAAVVWLVTEPRRRDEQPETGE